MITGELKRYNSISRVEVAAAHAAVHEGVLSGFLGGGLRGGRWVRELEDKWCKTFNVRNAIACNSATSGLLAAAAAIGLGPRDDFALPTLTMSATVVGSVLRAQAKFGDVEEETFNWDFSQAFRFPRTKALFITNLFGHPAQLSYMRAQCDGESRMRGHRLYMIEDNAQSPFAMERGQYAGTVGDIGVFSLNVHKHFQSGEGGICVTNNDWLADEMRHFINHGELAGRRVGLNLRMNEVTAAVAYAQLVRAPSLVQQRVEIAEAILAAIGNIPGIRNPVVREGCKHVYYTIPFLTKLDRREFCKRLSAEGVPISEGYQPVHQLNVFRLTQEAFCPVAERLHEKTLFYYENCAYDPTVLQIAQIGEAFKRVAEEMKL